MHVQPDQHQNDPNPSGKMWWIPISDLWFRDKDQSEFTQLFQWKCNKTDGIKISKEGNPGPFLVSGAVSISLQKLISFSFVSWNKAIEYFFVWFFSQNFQSTKLKKIFKYMPKSLWNFFIFNIFFHSICGKKLILSFYTKGN